MCNKFGLSVDSLKTCVYITDPIIYGTKILDFYTF
jgi:hypothetical protein